jgi:curved DNA-binding protein
MDAERLTHYTALGLNRRCSAAQVRDAYRNLVKRYHPDRNQQSTEAVRRSQELNEAHEVLSDPMRRRAYDRELDGDRSSARLTRAKRNISQDVSLRIEDFFRGTSLEVNVKDPANPSAETYRLIVPPMTAPGARFRLPRDAPFEGGFVQLRLRVLPGFRFKTRGSDLRCELRISARRATEGGTEMIASPTGIQLRLTIPARTVRGEVLRIRGEGLPRPRGGRGDLLVRITYRPEVRVSRTR